jgi:hypothetical protein
MRTKEHLREIQEDIAKAEQTLLMVVSQKAGEDAGLQQAASSLLCLLQLRAESKLRRSTTSSSPPHTGKGRPASSGRSDKEFDSNEQSSPVDELVQGCCKALTPALGPSVMVQFRAVLESLYMRQMLMQSQASAASDPSTTSNPLPFQGCKPAEVAEMAAEPGTNGGGQEPERILQKSKTAPTFGVPGGLQRSASGNAQAAALSGAERGQRDGTAIPSAAEGLLHPCAESKRKEQLQSRLREVLTLLLAINTSALWAMLTSDNATIRACTN